MSVDNMKTLTEFQLGYFVGFCSSHALCAFVVQWHPKSRHGAIKYEFSLSSRNRYAVEQLRATFGFGTVSKRNPTVRTGVSYAWRASRREHLLQLLPLVIQHVHHLRDRADLLLEFLRSRERGGATCQYSKREAEIAEVLASARFHRPRET